MGFSIPKLFVAIVFGHEIHFLFLNLAKIQNFIPKSAYGGGLGNIPKKKTISFVTAYLIFLAGIDESYV